MIARVGRILALFWPTLALAACGPYQPTRAYPEMPSSAARLPEQWTPTASPIPSATPIPSSTPLPTRIPLTALRRLSNIPLWLSAPDTAAIIENRGQGTEFGQVVAVNATSGEQFDFPFYAVERYLWLDAMRIGFLSPWTEGLDAKMTVLHLSDGSMQTIEWSGQETYAGGPGTSADGRFEENLGGLYGELSIVDHATGTEKQLSSPSDGFYYRAAAWSPAEPLIAELEEHSAPAIDDPTPDRLVIWDALSGRRVAVLDAQFERSPLFWSPDGEQLLFLEHITDDPLGAKPCLLTLSTARTMCLSGMDLVDPKLAYVPPWSWTGRVLRFLSCQADRSSILAYDLLRDEYALLPDDFLDNPGRRIIYFKPSPDDQYLLVAHDDHCPSSVRRPNPLEYGILNLASHSYVALSTTSNWPLDKSRWYELDRYFLWRPLPPGGPNTAP